MPTSGDLLQITITPDCESKDPGYLSWLALNPNSSAVILNYTIRNAVPDIVGALLLEPGETRFKTHASASRPFEYELEFTISGRPQNVNLVAHHRTLLCRSAAPSRNPNS